MQALWYTHQSASDAVLAKGFLSRVEKVVSYERIDATTVSSMDGHIWKWAGNIPPGFEPEFEPRLAHYSKCYTYTWFGSALQKHIHIQFGA